MYISILQLYKKIILQRFNEKVRGKKPVIVNVNKHHCGKVGHWLEVQMGVTPNANNKPDLFGFEMKNHTVSKTTFGDWKASYYIFENSQLSIDKDNFLKYFGQSNVSKNGRYSWSGSPCPKISRYNNFGQILTVDSGNNIIVKYSFSQDKRLNKTQIIPAMFQQNNLILARWDKEKISRHLEDKYNQNGWFKCNRDKKGIYTSIVFGKPISFTNWIELVKQGVVFFDSGMYQGNSRKYSQWRANNSLWSSLVEEIF